MILLNHSDVHLVNVHVNNPYTLHSSTLFTSLYFVAAVKLHHPSHVHGTCHCRGKRCVLSYMSASPALSSRYGCSITI